MKEELKVSSPRYHQIAVDVACKIVAGNYKVGQKIYARSSLASLYQVSPETVRRAICVLADLDIVKSEKGKGVVITSYDNAVEFVKQYENVKTIDSIKQNLISSIDRQKNEMESFSKYLNELILKTEHFYMSNPLMPYNVVINKTTQYLNKTVGEISFWQHTLATIIAIKRDDKLMISPGPYALLEEGDTLYFVGEDTVLDRVNNFLYGNKEELNDDDANEKS